jgi:hypothetical protein
MTQNLNFSPQRRALNHRSGSWLLALAFPISQQCRKRTILEFRRNGWNDGRGQDARFDCG